MLGPANLDQARTIVEFGPGTGVFTEAIIERMRPDARLFVFEINPVFAAELRARIVDARVAIFEASAADSPQLLQAYAALPVDAIISGLPFTSLPRPVTHAILKATVELLRPDGVFVTYQYTTMLRRLLRRYFPTMRITRFVVRNLPPAFVFAGSPRLNP